MKIVAFGASPSKNSINKKLATYAASLFENAEVEVLDLNDFLMPIFSVDAEEGIGQHALAQSFLDKMGSADFLVVSLAENNGNFSVAFKNIFDWCTRIQKEVFQNKPMLLLATSPGGRGGITVLELAKGAFPRFGAEVKGSFSLPNFDANFDTEKGQISNLEMDAELKKMVRGLQY